MDILNDSQLKKQKIFGIFLKNLDFAFSQFVVWKCLKNEAYTIIFHKNHYVWSTLTQSLCLGFSAELAKLTEKQNPRYGDVISIFQLLESGLDGCDETLSKIKKLRNGILMHNDLKTLTNIDNFMKELKLNHGDIEDLFQKLIFILDQVNNNYHNATNCKKYFSDLETFCQEDTRKFMTKLSESK